MPTIAACLVVMVLVLGAGCGDVTDEVRSGAAPDPSVVLDASELEVSESCGTRFVVRDRAGTRRLTIVSPAEVTDGGAEPGTYELGPGAWTGELEVGTGLVVWPCHDIGSDFERERVTERWTVVGGTVEVLDRIEPVPAGGGGGSGAVRAVVREVVFETPDGQIVEANDIEVSSDRWGFYGG